MKISIRHNQMEDVEGLHNEYPYAYHHVDLGATVVPWHWHEALEFNYVVSGSVKVTTTNQSFRFSQGEAFFINSNVLTTMTHTGGCILDSHLFDPVFLGGHFKSVFQTKYLSPVIQNRHIEIIPLRGGSQLQNKLLHKLRQLAQLQSQENTEFQTRNLLSEIWLLLLEDLTEQKSNIVQSDIRNQDRILTMMGWIHDNYANKITLEEIAAAAAISTRECLRCFRSSIGQSPMEYLISYRISISKKLLRSTDLPVAEVAIRTGFNTSAYFAKIFKQTTGKTPLVYRKEANRFESDALVP